MLGQAAQATISCLGLPQGNSCSPDAGKRRKVHNTHGSLVMVVQCSSHPHAFALIYLVQLPRSQHHGDPSQHQVWNPWTIEGGSVMIFFHCSILVTIVPLQLNFHLHSLTVHTQPHPQSCCLHIASCTALCTAIFLSI